MQRLGIYLPQRDASWMLPEQGGGGGTQGSAFDDSGGISNTVSTAKECGAKVCFCDKEEGRKYNFPDSLWELLVCHSCGSCAIHAKCGGMEDLIDPRWDCYICRRVTLPNQELAKRRQMPINEIWGTALGRKKQPVSAATAATSADTAGVTFLKQKSDRERYVI